MPFVRFSRDRRGYEHVYLVHTPAKRGKIGRPRVLYWFRSPPGVRVGREAFDENVRRALEQQHPDLTFDWKTLAAPPPPAPAVEPWRERRRLQKARKARAAGLDAGESADADLEPGDSGEGEAAEIEWASPVEVADDLLETDPDVVGLPPEGMQAAVAPEVRREREAGTRRRRRGGRRRQSGPIPSPDKPAE